MSFLLEHLRMQARLAPDAVSMADPTGRVLRRPELVAAIEAEMAALRARLADLERPVALLADRSIEACVLDLALLELAVPVLSLPLFFSEAQVAHAVAQSGVQMIIRSPQGELVREAVSDFDPAAAVPGDHALPAGTARISFTSGSTGTARGICLSAQNLLAVARGVVDAVGAAHVGRHLAVLPPGVLLEDVAGCHAALLSGATYIAASLEEVGLAAPFEPDFARMAAAIAATRATSLILVPEYLAGLVACLAHSGLRLPALTLVAVGGARVPPALLDRARHVGLPVRQGYGMTECGSVVSLHDGSDEGVGSVGRALGSHALRIGADGEVLVEGPKYLGCVGESPSAQALQAHAPGGLHHTGDIGRLDSAGRLWIEGRKSSLIINSFGRNISPEWPESLLLEQRAIAQVLVHGEGAPSLSALVVPRAGASDADIEGAIAAANASLPGYARIRHWRRARPFTPANGQLTGNGRLRRDRILAHYTMKESADAVL